MVLKKITAYILSLIIISLFIGCSGKSTTSVQKESQSKAVPVQTAQQNDVPSNQPVKQQSAPVVQSNKVDAAKNTPVSSKTLVTKNVSQLNKKIIPKVGAKNSSNIESVINEAVNYLKLKAAQNGYRIGDWDAITFSTAGKDINSSDFKKDGMGYIEYRAEAISKEIDKYYLTDYARTMLGVISAGYDPASFQGINLEAIIENAVTEEGKFKDTIEGGNELLNCHVWSMIALESAHETYDRQKAVKYIESKQNPDGGFYIFTQYPISDVDFTAMTVVALTMAGQDKNSPSVSKALGYLKSQLKQYEKNTSYESVETLATILQAAVCSKDDISTYKIKDKNIVDEILSFRNTDGGFRHLKTGPSNDISTRQALTALEFYKNNKNMYLSFNYKKGNYYAKSTELSIFILQNAFYDKEAGTVEVTGRVKNIDEVIIEISDGTKTYTEMLNPENGFVSLKKSLPQSNYGVIIKCKKSGDIVNIYNNSIENINNKIKAYVRIEGIDKTIVKKCKILLGNKKVYDYNGIPYNTGKISAYAFVIKSLADNFIESSVNYSWGAPFISAIDAISGGKFGGWDGWMYLINGKDPSSGMADVEIKDGDDILVYYGDWGIRPLSVTVPAEVQAGHDFNVVVKSDEKFVKEASVIINGQKYTTDENGTVKIKIDYPGVFEIYAEKNDSNGKPLYIRSERYNITIK